MLEKASVEFTKDEALLVAQFLKTTPITGTLETLPKAFTQVTTILQKLDTAFAGPSPEPEQPKRKR
jgi:hypothetical protein